MTLAVFPRFMSIEMLWTKKEPDLRSMPFSHVRRPISQVNDLASETHEMADLESNRDKFIIGHLADIFCVFADGSACLGRRHRIGDTNNTRLTNYIQITSRRPDLALCVSEMGRRECTH